MTMYTRAGTRAQKLETNAHVLLIEPSYRCTAPTFLSFATSVAPPSSPVVALASALNRGILSTLAATALIVSDYQLTTSVEA